MTTIAILDAKNDFHQVLRNLMHLYLYEFSEITGEDPDQDGMFVDEHLERYWGEPARYPFLILANGKYAGFVLVREMTERVGPEKIHSIAEFFILRKFRRQKIGQQVAWSIFDRFDGKWHVAEMEKNLAAQQFWRRIIAEYTHDSYEEVHEPGWDGPVQLFYALVR